MYLSTLEFSIFQFSHDHWYGLKSLVGWDLLNLLTRIPSSNNILNDKCNQSLGE